MFAFIVQDIRWSFFAQLDFIHSNLSLYVEFIAIVFHRDESTKKCLNKLSPVTTAAAEAVEKSECKQKVFCILDEKNVGRVKRMAQKWIWRLSPLLRAFVRNGHCKFNLSCIEKKNTCRWDQNICMFIAVQPLNITLDHTIQQQCN